jgi:hypothetical protein
MSKIISEVDKTLLGSSSFDMTYMSPFAALSFYSPIIMVISILLFSVFSAAAYKGFVYIFFLFAATAARMLIMSIMAGDMVPIKENPICETGLFLPYTNLTYSTYILVFSLVYFVSPMFIISKQNKTNTVNYSVILFFVTYVVYDILVKYYYKCIDMTSGILGDFLSAILLALTTVVCLIASQNTNVLFINELTSNKEVCTRPSKQQFKCSVYKNGEVIGSSIPQGR